MKAATPDWFKDSIFYHIYPIGFCDVQYENPNSQHSISLFVTQPNGNVSINDVRTAEWKQSPNHVSNHSPILQTCTVDFINHLKKLGITAVYIGPLFQSKRHGYDTSDFFSLDSRLGTSNNILRQMIHIYHTNNIKVIFDAVYNHVGRDFWAFRDVLQNCERSNYVQWFFTSLDYSAKQNQRHYNDPFSYEGWNGCYDLIKLNLHNPNVVRHLLAATKFWIDDLGIDGLRLDAADCVLDDFWRLLRIFVDGRWHMVHEFKYDQKPINEFFSNEVPISPNNARRDFLLLGEVTQGDYKKWACPKTMFHSVTNYELWKAIWSSLKGSNMFGLSDTLERQWRSPIAPVFDDILLSSSSLGCPRREHHKESGYGTVPPALWLYTFLDNHDQERISSKLKTPLLEIAIILSYMVPGVPSIYYGTEFGFKGSRGKGPNADNPLRPKMQPSIYTDAINAKECPNNWEQYQYDIYCLYKQMGMLYHNSLIHDLVSRGQFYIYHVTASSIGFIRFVNNQKGQQDTHDCKYAHNRILLVCISLNPIELTVPRHLIETLLKNSETNTNSVETISCNKQIRSSNDCLGKNIEFIDIFDPPHHPMLKRTTNQDFQIQVDYMCCLIVGYEIQQLKERLPSPIFSIKRIKQTLALVNKQENAMKLESHFSLGGEIGETTHTQIEERCCNQLERYQNIHQILEMTESSNNRCRVLNHLKWTWNSTFRDKNLCDIGYNIQQLFDPEYGLLKNEYNQHLLEIDLRTKEFQLDDTTSNSFQWALLLVALCLPAKTILRNNNWLNELAPLFEWLSNYNDVLRYGKLHIHKVEKNILIMSRETSKAELFLYIRYPEAHMTLEIPRCLASTDGFRVTSGKLERITSSLADLQCHATLIMIMARKNP